MIGDYSNWRILLIACIAYVAAVAITMPLFTAPNEGFSLYMSMLHPDCNIHATAEAITQCIGAEHYEQGLLFLPVWAVCGFFVFIIMGNDETHVG